ncbi:MAG: amino acid adenylation domain-containing protein [Lachnospiraceae bacterium]|nr:amino acid adenylation domain-containing protein [Lachnospiraceae bacterium]
MIRNVLDYLDIDAAKAPDRIALEDEYGCMTYSEVRNSARIIGTFVARKVSVTDRPVAVIIDRNARSIVSFFGIVYSGNFYVPIDASMPAERVALILETLSPVMIIDARKTDNVFEGAVSFDELITEDVLKSSGDELAQASLIDEKLLSCINSRMIDQAPLYSIFTSGSTGVPKGVLISHRGVLDLVQAFEEAFSFDEETVFCNQAPFDFDVSVKDIYNSLYCCGRIVIAPRKLFMSPKLLVSFLAEKKIDTLIWAVSALRIISDFKALDNAENIPALKRVMFSGEVMPAKSLNYWKKMIPSAKYVNLYGPTEITCNCTYYVIDRDFADDEKIPVGKPFVNSRVELRDESLKVITDKNVTGEICVSGKCLALGYWNNKEKTDEAFVTDPCNPEYPVKMYRTGDLGFYDEDGNIVFASRRDHQIKHMGHRIELGEIETALNSISFLTISVCVYEESKEKIICFYQADTECKKEIVAELSKKLPKYMWPNEYVRYDVLPLNKNGKIDRKLLRSEWEQNNG